MTPDLFLEIGITPALRLLPARFDSIEARAMIVAICLQESALKHRRQVGGPARGYAQFEKGGGVVGVLTHATSMAHAISVCAQIDIAPEANAVYTALEYNDVLAAAFARLLLWTSPLRVPKEHEALLAWQLYLSTWRPGKPHPSKWNDCYANAWRVVQRKAALESAAGIA